MDEQTSNYQDSAEESRQAQADLRRTISATLIARAGSIADAAVAIFPFGEASAPDVRNCHRIGRLLAEMLGHAVGSGHSDSANDLVCELRRRARECAASMATLFHLAYLTERIALDELAVDQAIGATSETWTLVAQFVRRGSFDMLAAYAELAHFEPISAAITDRLTTLYTRAVFDAALVKVLDRAGRFGDPVSVILFDVDRLSTINRECGYGVGDRLLERLGILVKGFFRQHDWIARYNEDAMAVILSRTEADDAATLAERVRATVKERLEFLDHRSERAVSVTISAGVVNIATTRGSTIDATRVMTDAEAALARAKEQGGNRVELTNAYSRSS